MKTEKSWGALGANFLFVVLVAVPLSLWQGYVLTCLWEWFIVPILHWPVLLLWQAVGILTTARFVRGEVYQDPDVTIGARVFACVMNPLVVLGLSWVLKTLLVPQ